jgi:sialidase-1
MLKQYTVSRDDSVYECFPDVVKTKSGKLICVFRESTHHGDLNGSRLVYKESADGGKTWSEKYALTQRMDASFAYNCPRISTLPSGELIIICDVLNRIVDEDLLENCEQHIFRSLDDGKTWSAPEALPFKGIVPDKYQVLSNGRHIFGIHRRDSETRKLTQYAYYSDDHGKTWTETVIASDNRYELCEVSIVEINGILVAFMRENSGLGYSCKKAFSYDFGATWEGVYDTNIDCCHRPVVAKCENGMYLMTYRYMQGGKGWLGHWTQNLFGAFFNERTALAKERKEQSVRIFPISFDRSARSDMGYSGWVELEKDLFYVVNYLLDDAPKAQIKGYAFEMNDVIII